MEAHDQFDFLFKIVILGDAGVGKSSLLLRYADELFNPVYINTIGVDFRIRTLLVEDKLIKLQIGITVRVLTFQWDTAGQERFRNITASFYRGSHGIILTFDLSNKESFLRLDKWLAELERNVGHNVIRVMVGTKSDLVSRREVSYTLARAYSEKMKLAYAETSAKLNLNVDELFLYMAKEILTKVKLGLIDTNDKKISEETQTVSVVNTETEKPRKKSCC
ncbi:uncharacterized protein LOC129585983 isoform X2 [Paramacrobiotus metropolitanus]|uniref:uncharacterized protein LOC129585983 isoform X2 n=1 Tax=Paramacrobiotus metropolitanus TaxID=2943436 RepID=UPI0024456D86|nr:uncharacterized protein LOC129585983 isoform X2 [Paramacrobiotus metropolitanus]